MNDVKSCEWKTVFWGKHLCLINFFLFVYSWNSWIKGFEVELTWPEWIEPMKGTHLPSIYIGNDSKMWRLFEFIDDDDTKRRFLLILSYHKTHTNEYFHVQYPIK